MKSFRATGVRRYTRKHLRADRDAAVRHGHYLLGRLERSAQANRELAGSRDEVLAQNRALTQQAEVTDALVAKVHAQVRELKAQVAALAKGQPGWPVPAWTADPETTVSIPRDQLPQTTAA